VTRADSPIGQIVNVARQVGMYEQTLFGGETLAEVEYRSSFPVKGVKKAYDIQYPVFQYDNAATVAFAVGVTQPYAWIGPVKSAFEGFPDLIIK